MYGKDGFIRDYTADAVHTVCIELFWHTAIASAFREQLVVALLNFVEFSFGRQCHIDYLHNKAKII